MVNLTFQNNILPFPREINCIVEFVVQRPRRAQQSNPRYRQRLNSSTTSVIIKFNKF